MHGPDIVPVLVSWEVAVYLDSVLLHDRADEEIGADEPLVVKGGAVGVLGVLHPQRSHHGHTSYGTRVENRVPEGQQCVPLHGGLAKHLKSFVSEKPGFSPGGVVVSVATEERLVGS